jgi:hypothetical protein
MSRGGISVCHVCVFVPVCVCDPACVCMFLHMCVCVQGLIKGSEQGIAGCLILLSHFDPGGWQATARGQAHTRTHTRKLWNAHNTHTHAYTHALEHTQHKTSCQQWNMLGLNGIQIIIPRKSILEYNSKSIWFKMYLSIKTKCNY